MSLADYDREVQHNTEMTKAHNREGVYSSLLWDKNPLESIGEIKRQSKEIRKITKKMEQELREIDKKEK